MQSRDVDESIDYTALKLVGNFVKDGVRYILRGDKKAANELMGW